MTMQTKAIKRYLGITLTFATHFEGNLCIEKPSFLVRESNLTDTINKANKIGKRKSWGQFNKQNNFIKYLGLDDVFGVVGPIGDGAMMGQTSKFSYKNLERAKRLMSRYGEFSMDQKGCDPAVDGNYLVEFIYFLGHPAPYKSRRALVCLGVVNSLQKDQVVKRSIELAESTKFKRKITLLDYGEKFCSDLLVFVGVSDVRPIYEKLRVGNCFDIGYREIKNFSAIKQVTIPDPNRFEYVFDKMMVTHLGGRPTHGRK